MNTVKNDKRFKAAVLAATVLLSTALCVFFMYTKQGYHEDELLTFNLANSGSTVEADAELITPNDIKAVLDISPEARFDYVTVYENQIKDGVHPPLYYILFHTVCSLFPGVFSKWLPFFINAIFNIFTLILLYKCARLITGRFKYAYAAMVAYALSIACITTVIYIRMYAMLTFFTVAFSYITMLIYNDGNTKNNKHIALMAVVCFFGNLTHYYFIMYELLTGITMLIVTLKKKRARVMKKYIITGVLTGIASICVYPYVVANVLLGNRGLDTGGLSIDAALAVSYVIYKLCAYVTVLAKDLFSESVPLFIFITVSLAAVLIYMRTVRKKKISPKSKLIFIPSVIFLVVISLVSPFNSNRYIMCVLPLLTVFVVTSFIRFFRMLKFKRAYTLVLVLILIFSTLGLVTVKPHYTYGKTNLYEPRTKSCLFVGTDMREWYKSLDKLMQYDSVMIAQTDMDMGFINELETFAESRGVKTNGKITQIAGSYLESANKSDDKNNLSDALANKELCSYDEITVYISRLCNSDSVVESIISQTPFDGCELIQKDIDFNDYYNWYDYFAETESYCDVYRFYKTA